MIQKQKKSIIILGIVIALFTISKTSFAQCSTFERVCKEITFNLPTELIEKWGNCPLEICIKQEMACPMECQGPPAYSCPSPNPSNYDECFTLSLGVQSQICYYIQPFLSENSCCTLNTTEVKLRNASSGETVTLIGIDASNFIYDLQNGIPNGSQNGYANFQYGCNGTTWFGYSIGLFGGQNGDNLQIGWK